MYPPWWREVPYSGKVSRLGTKRAEKTFADCSSNYYVGVATNFAEKTFTDGSDTAKNAKVFSLKNFAGIYVYIYMPSVPRELNIQVRQPKQ